MRELDPGHLYELASIPTQPCEGGFHGQANRCQDHGGLNILPTGYCRVAAGDPQRLGFVKREGEKFPGNVGSYPGTTTQEVLRALIARAKYVDAQIPHAHNKRVVGLLRRALFLLEDRAAERGGWRYVEDPAAIENTPLCPKCGHHVGIEGHGHD